MRKLFPFLNSLENYNLQFFKGDLSAGLTVGVMLIPQGMAYAMIAGLPPVYGLYAAIFPQIIYTLFGTSRQLAVGPVAMDSLLVATGVSTLAVVGTEHYIALAILLALLMGLIQISLGVLRLGFLVNFVSIPVIKGFTFAAALIIGFSQLKHLLGIDIVQSKYLLEIIFSAIEKIDELNAFAFVIGFSGIVLLALLKKTDSKFPGGLAIVACGIAAVYFFDLSDMGVNIVGAVPEGMPTIEIPDITWTSVKELFPIALTLAMIAFMESFAVAKSIQQNHRKEYEIDANRELIGLGMANVVGSIFSSYSTGGGFSRSVVNDSAGAHTGIASLISAGLVLITLLFLTPLFFYLPKAVLASIIMVAVFGLVDLKEVKYLFKTDRYDFFMLLASFVGTLVFGIEKGILLGVLLSIFVLVYKTSDPHMALLGKVKGTNHFRNLGRYQTAIDLPDVAILRFDARLYFANINSLKDKIEEIINAKPELKTFILDAQSISDIDSTGLSGLTDIVNSFQDIGITFKMVSVIGPVRDKLHLSGFLETVGLKNFYPSVAEAMGDSHDSDIKFQTNT